jgi:hypothetical protein
MNVLMIMSYDPRTDMGVHIYLFTVYLMTLSVA